MAGQVSALDIQGAAAIFRLAICRGKQITGVGHLCERCRPHFFHTQFASPVDCSTGNDGSEIQRLGSSSQAAYEGSIPFTRSIPRWRSVSRHEPAQRAGDPNPHQGHDGRAEQKLRQGVGTSTPDHGEFPARQQAAEFLGEGHESGGNCACLRRMRLRRVSRGRPTPARPRHLRSRLRGHRTFPALALGPSHDARPNRAFTLGTRSPIRVRPASRLRCTFRRGR